VENRKRGEICKTGGQAIRQDKRATHRGGLGVSTTKQMPWDLIRQKLKNLGEVPGVRQSIVRETENSWKQSRGGQAVTKRPPGEELRQRRTGTRPLG